MAYLNPQNSNQRLYLRDTHIIGRRTHECDTTILSPQISRSHAIIEWDQDRWLLSSTGRNGIRIDDKFFSSCVRMPLSEQQRLEFPDTHSTTFLVANIDPPENLLIQKNKTINQSFCLEQYQLIPSEENPEYLIFLSDIDGTWYSQQVDQANSIDPTPMAHGDKITTRQGNFELFIGNTFQEPTQALTQPCTLDEFTFCFTLSLDEETTNLRLESRDLSIDLDIRSHHDLLVHLARIAMEDWLSGLPRNDQGWIDNELLAREIGLETSHINILLYRAKKQISRCNPAISGVEYLVERRPGQTRFGCSKVEIHKGRSIQRMLQRSLISQMQ